METDLFGTTEASAPSSLLRRYAAVAGRDFTTALRTIRDLQGHGFNRNCRSTLQSASLTRASPASTAEPPQESAPEFRRLDLTREKTSKYETNPSKSSRWTTQRPERTPPKFV
jgi:hypothetical protein